MKCALCGNEIRGRDYINASTPEKEIYVHSMPCDFIVIPRSSAAIGTSQSNIFKRVYTFYIDGRIKACKPLCV
jgi:hypothetical protein